MFSKIFKRKKKRLIGFCLLDLYSRRAEVEAVWPDLRSAFVSDRQHVGLLPLRLAAPDDVAAFASAIYETSFALGWEAVMRSRHPVAELPPLQRADLSKISGTDMWEQRFQSLQELAEEIQKIREAWPPFEYALMDEKYADLFAEVVDHLPRKRKDNLLAALAYHAQAGLAAGIAAAAQRPDLRVSKQVENPDARRLV